VCVAHRPRDQRVTVSVPRVVDGVAGDAGTIERWTLSLGSRFD
jgi:hypothetical protein